MQIGETCGRHSMFDGPEIQAGGGTMIENNTVSSSGANCRGRALVGVAARSFAVGSGPIDAVLCS